MDGTLRDDVVIVGDNARQQFYDARGYGTPAGGNEIRLSRVEAAHLLFRGDLGVVVDSDTGGILDFRDFFVASASAADRFTLRFLVYADLRDRGFYLSPAREGWPGGDDAGSGGDDAGPTGDTEATADDSIGVDTDRIDLTVYPRGTKPGAGDPAHRIAVVGEREAVTADGLRGITLAVVDEESEISYLETGRPGFDGGTTYTPPAELTGSLLDDRVVVWNAPSGFYEHGFYGQPLTAREAIVDNAVQLSLVEAAGLAASGHLSLVDTKQPAVDVIRDRGRAVEGDRFDRRLAVYRALREQRVVPKTGYKFGADFRTYDTVESVESLPHSERLIRVVDADHAFDPRALSLDVRLAGGVRKRMVFALTAANGDIHWLTVSRLTP